MAVPSVNHSKFTRGRFSSWSLGVFSEILLFAVHGQYTPMDANWTKDISGEMFIVQARPETKTRHSSEVRTSYTVITRTGRNPSLLIGHQCWSIYWSKANQGLDAHIDQRLKLGKFGSQDKTDGTGNRL